MSKQQGRYSGLETGGRPPFPPEVKNGRIPLSMLGRCETQAHAAHPLLYKPAAIAFDGMTRAAKQDGVTIEAAALYRDYSGQVFQKARWTKLGKPENAAKPGTSNHGYGVAADVNRYLPDVLPWLAKHGPQWGWDHPLWAGIDKGPEFGREPWHWQYILGAVIGSDEPEIPVYVAGTLLPDADAYRDEGQIMVELRPVAMALGWIQIHAEGGTADLVLSATVRTAIDYVLHDGHGYVPVRALGEKLQVPVTWDEAARVVRIG